MSTTVRTTRSGLEAYEKEPFAERQRHFKACLNDIAALCDWKRSEFVRDRATLAKSYSVDKSSHIPSVPVAAVRPRSVSQMAAVVRLCAKHKLPMTPRGAGSGLEGACIPYAGGIVLDTDNLQGVTIDKENSCVWAGAGVRKLQLNKAVQKEGFVFGPDPSSNPSVGGMVATSGSGMSTLRYGTTRENVLALRVVTPQGHIIQTRRAVRKSSSGLDLTNLYTGSEGTLGVVCEVCFRLFPRTNYNGGGVISFDSTANAVKAVVALKQQGVPETLLRCELLNIGAVRCSNAFSHTNLPEAATVLLEFVTNERLLHDVHRDYNQVLDVFNRYGPLVSAQYLHDLKSLNEMWEARRGCLFAAMHSDAKKGAQPVITTDVCVPINRLAACITETEEDFAADGRPCIICAHISDGNFHTLIPYCDPADFKKARELESRMVKRALQMDGSVSGEHGVGIGKVHHVELEHGKEHIRVQESIKKTLDPDNLMNPGCFYPSQQLLYPTAHL